LDGANLRLRPLPTSRRKPQKSVNRKQSLKTGARTFLSAASPRRRKRPPNRKFTGGNRGNGTDPEDGKLPPGSPGAQEPHGTSKTRNKMNWERKTLYRLKLPLTAR
jgi:hypothetical protein